MAIEWDVNLNLEDFLAQVEERMPASLAKGMEHIKTVTTPKVVS